MTSSSVSQICDVVLQDVINQVVAKFPTIGKPIAAWDGITRVYILREQVDSIFSEVWVYMSPWDETDLVDDEDSDSIRVSVGARAWTSDGAILNKELMYIDIPVQSPASENIRENLYSSILDARKIARKLVEQLPEFWQKRQRMVPT